MLSEQYDILVNNMWLTEIIAVILLLIPVFLIFVNWKWIFFYYTISIVANLPLVFMMRFSFSYEAIIGFVIIINIIKNIVKEKSVRYQTTKENILLIIMLVALLGVNLLTSLFHFNATEYILRLFIYFVNIFILVVYTYFFEDSKKIKLIKNGFIIGALILVFSMIVEMIYGYYILDIKNMRPAGLLLDPNVCAFALNLTFVLSFLNRKTSYINDLLIILARIIILFGIFLTVSRSAYIGTIFSLLALLIYYSKGKRRWIASSVIIIFIVMYGIFYNTVKEFFSNIYKMIDLGRIIPNEFYLPSPIGTPTNSPVDNVDYSNARLSLIKAAFIIFSNNFIIGVGIGNVTKEISIITNMEMNSHNLYLQLLAESGIIMLIFILIFIYYLFVFLGKIENKYKFIISVLFGLIFIESMFNHNILNLNIIFLVFAIILGLAMLSSKDRKVYFLGRKKYKQFF